ncbi:DNA-binding response regulator, LytR/AlgR family [Flexibacter flexilis DSM 6793]|uniref:DNA-binding response regulator, LytR/AlgR family n=1 Tax=Flexibacter flexilis DSM 6793 TaxID=927664 RepID=A0A1I1E3K9_9BACT|nr:response regulator transcription factor [Flexibacter flexilis]SFB81694.1 DNA-binding response regulator, LytR/AlgR family [Flexibacter flexilis DSM 6793]
MIKYTCIIIEDEPLAMERTKMFVEKTPFLQLLACFENALEGVAFLKANKVEVLFLDINMDEISGIELLETFRIEAQVIITTAYPNYALKGYELNVTDYLLKPFTFERFLQSVNKIQDKKPATLAAAPQFLFIKTENRLEKVNIDDILFIEGMRDYRRIHTTTKKIMTLQNFSEFEQLIPANQICRVHKSYMLAISKIDSVERGRIRIADQLIPISETYRDAFFQRIGG